MKKSWPWLLGYHMPDWVWTWILPGILIGLVFLLR